MKVEELIDELKKYPKDMTIFLYNEKDGFEVDIIKFNPLQYANYLEIVVY